MFFSLAWQPRPCTGWTCYSDRHETARPEEWQVWKTVPAEFCDREWPELFSLHPPLVGFITIWQYMKALESTTPLHWKKPHRHETFSSENWKMLNRKEDDWKDIMQERGKLDRLTLPWLSLQRRNRPGSLSSPKLQLNIPTPSVCVPKKFQIPG